MPPSLSLCWGYWDGLLSAWYFDNSSGLDGVLKFDNCVILIAFAIFGRFIEFVMFNWFTSGRWAYSNPIPALFSLSSWVLDDWFSSWYLDYSSVVDGVLKFHEIPWLHYSHCVCGNWMTLWVRDVSMSHGVRDVHMIHQCQMACCMYQVADVGMQLLQLLQLLYAINHMHKVKFWKVTSRLATEWGMSNKDCRYGYSPLWIQSQDIGTYGRKFCVSANVTECARVPRADAYVWH